MPPPVEGVDVAIIAGGPHPAGTSRNAQKRYVSEIKTHDITLHVLEPRALKYPRIELLLVTFSEDDVLHVQFPHNDPIVVTIQVAN